MATPTPGQAGLWPILFASGLGVLLGLSLLKFGNPIILDKHIDPPRSGWEYVFQPWPARWGQLLLLVCAGLALGASRWPGGVPRWLIALPCSWLGWQFLAGLGTVDLTLTRSTLVHFGSCVLCFFLGLCSLTHGPGVRRFWGGLLAGFALVLWAGFEQHYGGLEATRRMFYEQPNWEQFPPDYIRKIQSDRIFSTLVYPNALAAAILLLLPPALVMIWKATGRLTDPSRAVITGVAGYAGAACLYWSGSKSGWLIALVLVLAAVLGQPFSRRIKGAIIAVVVVAGLAGFFIKYAPYFRRGAPSVSARMDYWNAALRTSLENPVMGTGPGTFSVAYKRIKPPEAEMAQLTHNDYLEQASDSGWPGALAYAAFVLGSVVLLPMRKGLSRCPELFAAWLGLLGWSLQSFVEFLLYIPALGWTAFTFLGWLWAAPCRDNEIDRSAGRR